MAKQNIKIDPGTVVAIGAGIVVIWALQSVKGLLNAFGLTQSKASRDLDREASNTLSPWSPELWKRGGAGTKILTVATMVNMFNKLENAWGYFDDDEEAVKAVIKSVTTQSQMSYFAYWLQQNKSIDLFDYLRGGAAWHRLEDTDMDELTDYLKQLPKYK